MSDSGSWAPFGRSTDDDEPSDPPAPAPVEEPGGESPSVREPEPEPAPVQEPEPVPEPEPPPPVSFAPPTPPPLATPPTLGTPAPLAWPDPTPAPVPPVEAAGRQAPWPPQGFQDRKAVPSDATVALVLGIASLFFCGFVGPFAIHYGLKARRQIDADPALGGRGLATWGYALGIVSTAVLVIGLTLIAAGVIVLT